MEMKNDLDQFIPPDGVTKTMISIQNARKRYSGVKVLNGLNMTVPEGTIYGLLGPSGCGKTTILNCITGRTELDSGTIDLKINKLKHVGYMPQSVCILGGLTIIENFYFHGYLYGMTNERINDKGANLISFLELPSKHTLIDDLSGGSQRRVSLATALLHNPKLLILDEPTVGLDPILNYSIWERLKEMSKSGVTILITTHYVQEAHNNHVIGLMRNGVLVAEDDPAKLLRVYECIDLEEVFLKLSIDQSNNKREKVNQVNSTKKSEESFKVHFENDDRLFSYSKFKGLTYKTISVLKRSYIVILTVFLLPFLNTYLFNIAIGRTPKGLYLAVVNEEIHLGDCSASRYEKCIFAENETVTLSCLFLNIMENKSYNFIEYDYLSNAIAEMKNSNFWGLLHFKRNFSSSMANRISLNVLDDDANYTISSSTIDTWLDMSNQYIGTFISYDLVRSMTSFLEDIMQICDLNPKLGSLPISFEQPIYGNFDENFITYSSAALICIYCFMLPSIWSSMQIYLEKTDGILERTLVAGANMFDISVSVFVFQFVIHILQTAVSLYVMYVMFDNPLEGNFTFFCILMILTGTAGIFFGIILGLIFDNLVLLGATSTGTMITLTLVTGVVWPTEGSHWILQILHWFFPLTWTVDATRVLTIKAFPVLHPIMIKGLLAVIFLNVSLAGFICIIPVLKKTILRNI